MVTVLPRRLVPDTYVYRGFHFIAFNNACMQAAVRCAMDIRLEEQRRTAAAQLKVLEQALEGM